MNKQVTTLTPETSSVLSISGVHEYLTMEGFRPTIDEDGDIRFKAEGRVYFIRFDSQDHSFVRLCAINVASSLELSMEQALNYANKVCADIKVSKAFCLDRDGKPVIWVTAECRYANTDEFTKQLEHLISGIRAAVDHIYEVHKKDALSISEEDSEVKAIH